MLVPVWWACKQHCIPAAGWAGIISKKNLAYVSKHMRDICNQCSYLSSENPSILSACLVSLEAQPSFQVMSDALKMEEKPSSNCPLQTPRDASTSHILVFPTSATAQVRIHVRMFGLTKRTSSLFYRPVLHQYDYGKLLYVHLYSMK